MKVTNIVCASIMSLLFFIAAYACPGCIDNSWHLQREIDNKEYHLVECNCPCEKKYFLNIRNRLQCENCSHYHDPKPFIFIGNADKLQASALQNKQCQ